MSAPRRATPRRCHAVAVEMDAGMGLVEVLVALFVVASVLLTGAAAFVSSMTAAGHSTASSRATQVASEALERLHSLPWNTLGLYSNDPNFTTTFEGHATAALPTMSVPDPRVPLARQVVRRGPTDFVVRTYIVRVPDTDTTRAREAQRRLTVLVQWTSGGGPLRQVRAETTRTPTTGESGHQCFALRSLEVTVRDASSATTFDPFALTGERTVPTGSQLLVSATTNLPAGSVTLTHPRIDTTSATVTSVTVAMAKVAGDERSWQYVLPPDEQFTAGQQTFTATATASVSTPACPSSTAVLESYPRFTHPAGASSAGKRIATGGDHSCWISGAGQVWCWGKGSGTGVLGVGNSNPSSIPVRAGVGVPGFTDLVSISAGDTHSCAVTGSGNVWCWGINNQGQVGDGTVSTRESPVQVSGVSDAVAVTAGSAFTCVLTRGGRVRCWGGGAAGQLGNGTLSGSLTAGTAVVGLDKAVGVSAGTEHACAVTSAGAVWCWGNGAGLRLNGATSSASPVQITLPGSPAPLARQVAANTGAAAHTCVVVTTGQVYCWGANDKGQAAPGAAPSTTVQQVTGLPAAVYVTAGLQYSCATVPLPDGNAEAWCWGANGKGQLGNDNTNNGANAPTKVFTSTGMVGPVDVSASDAHTCARVLDASAWCWGHNNNGKLGNGSTVDSSQPVRASGT